ncbi:MAG: DUF927 domain-containing protein [Thermodesulfobacteriota bacterium]
MPKELTMQPPVDILAQQEMAKALAGEAQAFQHEREKAPPGAAGKPGNTRADKRNGIPDGFRLTPAGVYASEEDQDGKLDWTWFCGPLEVRALTRSQESQDWGRLLVFRDPDGAEHSWSMPAELLAGDGLEYRKELHALGLDIAPGRKARNALHCYISGCRPETRVRCVNRLGWHGQNFILPDGAIGPAGDEAVIFQGTTVPTRFSQAGTLTDWQVNIGRLCYGNSRLVFAVSAALAAPLLRLAGLEGGGFHFRGASSIGKSTALAVAASAWSGPDFLRSWRTTANGLEGIAAGHNDCLLCLDELSQVSGRDAGEVAYMLANGAGKSRMRRDSSLRKPMTWRVLFLSTGEMSLADKLTEAGLRTRAGQEVRVLDLPADADQNLGIFEHLHGFRAASEFADQLREAAGMYHGTLARAFLERITADQAGLPEALGQARREFHEQHVPSGASGQVARAADRFGLTAAAGSLATAMGLLPWPESEAMEAAGRLFRDWLAERGGTAPQEITAGLEQVRRFFQAHGESRFSPWAGDGDRPTINRAGYRREGEFLIFPEVFKCEICAGFDLKQIVRALIDRHLLTPGQDGKSTSVFFRDGKSQRFYRIMVNITGGAEVV